MAAITLDPARFEAALGIVRRSVAEGAHPSAVVAVAGCDQVRGMAAIPGADVVTERSPFLLASITKPIMATAVMQLVEAGALLLDTPISTVVPEFTGDLRETITPWHVLTHTTGIDETQWYTERVAATGAVQSCVECACVAPLLSKPGAWSRYCTLSFALLAEMIMRLTGVPYDQYLRERIFDPLGMTTSGFDSAGGVPVHDFQGDLGQFVSRKVAGGGLWASASDLVLFGQAFLRALGGQENPLLSQAGARSMVTLQTEGLLQDGVDSPVPVRRGLAWGLPTNCHPALSSPAAFEHGGATGTLLWLDPQWDLVYVFLTNRWGIPFDVSWRALNSIYAGLRGGGL